MNRAVPFFLLTFVFLAGCNTFGEAPSFGGPAEPELDTGLEDAGKTPDAAEMPDTGDSGLVEVDMGSDDGGIDMGVDAGATIDWTAGPPAYPSLTSADWMAAEPCATAPVDLPISYRVPAELEFLTVPIGGSDDADRQERMVFITATEQDELRIELLNLDGTDSEQLYESESLALRDDENTRDFSAIALRNQLVVAAINSSSSVVLIRCSFVGDPVCEAVPSGLQAEVVAMGTRGQQFYLYASNNMGALDEYAIESEASLGLGSPSNVFTAGAASSIRSIHFGLLGNDPGLAYYLDFDGAPDQYAFASFSGGGGWISETGSQNPPNVEVARPIFQFLPRTGSGWAATGSSGGGFELFSVELASGWVWETSPIETEVLDVHFVPLDRGFIELKVKPMQYVVVIDDALNNPSAPTFQNGGISRPARAAAAEGRIGIANFDGGPNVLMLCQP